LNQQIEIDSKQELATYLKGEILNEDEDQLTISINKKNKTLIFSKKLFQDLVSKRRTVPDTINVGNFDDKNTLNKKLTMIREESA